LKISYKWSSKKLLLISLIALAIGFLLPQQFVMPVDKADKHSYNHETFWYYPWGKSVTHKGVDIFAKEGTKVFSATHGLVIYSGHLSMGGKVVAVLGPKWRIHYYAHLQEIHTSGLSLVKAGRQIGTVGTSGNARGTPPHLHYSIGTTLPYIWKADNGHHGWLKMFYLNPLDYLVELAETRRIIA
jgi:peptidoglycan LD-endopeptidase LytH